MESAVVVEKVSILLVDRLLDSVLHDDAKVVGDLMYEVGDSHTILFVLDSLFGQFELRLGNRTLWMCS